MRSGIVIVLIVLCTAFAWLYFGRQPPRQAEHIIRWSHGVTLTSVIYTFDGDTLGRGEKAYESLMRLIQSLPNGSHLRIECPRDVAELMLEITGSMEPLPFHGYEKERSRFDAIRAEKLFRITIDSYPYDE